MDSINRVAQEREMMYPPLSMEIIHAFLDTRKQTKCHKRTLSQDRNSALCLYQFLPEDKHMTPERLEAFRQELRENGYAPTTISAYSKSINCLLDYLGITEMQLSKGNPHDLTGKQYGSLTVIALTGKKYRKSNIWLCRCVCGKEIEVPTTSLTMGNTTSCGCLKKNVLRAANRYISNTSLRQSLADNPVSTRAASGYTGVTANRGKWKAYIGYQGKRYDLGTYAKLEDAVKARARAKELVQEDALGLEKIYLELHGDEPAPHRPQKPDAIINRKEIPHDRPAIRSDNTSGFTGVIRKKGKWSASITVQGKRYFLGCYETLEKAIEIRKQAEHCARMQDIETLNAMCTLNNPAGGTPHE